MVIELLRAGIQAIKHLESHEMAGNYIFAAMLSVILHLRPDCICVMTSFLAQIFAKAAVQKPISKSRREEKCM